MDPHLSMGATDKNSSSVNFNLCETPRAGRCASLAVGLGNLPVGEPPTAPVALREPLNTGFREGLLLFIITRKQ